jgi:hypothetical protein
VNPTPTTNGRPHPAAEPQTPAASATSAAPTTLRARLAAAREAFTSTRESLALRLHRAVLAAAVRATAPGRALHALASDLAAAGGPWATETSVGRVTWTFVGCFAELRATRPFVAAVLAAVPPETVVAQTRGADGPAPVTAAEVLAAPAGAVPPVLNARAVLEALRANAGDEGDARD